MPAPSIRRCVGVLVAALLLSCAHDDGESALAQVHARGVITWGADLLGGEPYVFEDPENPGRVIGFEVEIMEAVARHLGVRQQVVQFNWSTLIPSLQRGDFDLTMNGIEATADRAEQALLSKPYYVYSEMLAVRDDSGFTSLDSLAGRPVGTLAESVAHDLLKASKADIRLYDGMREVYEELVNGRLDGVLLDDVIAHRYGCGMAHVRCIPTDLAFGSYVAAFRKGDADLRDAFDDALDALRVSGELRRILEKWKLWGPRQAEPPPTQTFSTRPRSFDGDQLTLFVDAAWVTVQVSVLAFLLAVPLGLLLALARVYAPPLVSGVARAYIELFRGTPVLLQLYLIYYGMADVWKLGPLAAAVIGLGLNYAAYEAEVYRAAILAVPHGQAEASKALGLGPWQTLRHVLVPQAFTIALPAMTNDFVSLLKDSSLIGAIASIELTKRMYLSSNELHSWVVPGIACALFYLVLSFPLSELARRLERRLVRDHRPRTL